MWFDETLDARAQPLVEALLALLANSQRWRHPRVETLTPVSAAFVRRRISIDFTVPGELHAGLQLSGTRADGQWLVPLGWLARRQLVNFDLRSAADEPVPLLLAQETARLTEDLLVLAAVRARLNTDDAVAVGAATAIIERAADERPVEDVESLERRARALALDEQFASLVGASARGFLLLAALPKVAGRQVVKLQSDEHYRGARFALSPELPGLNEAASTHVELDLPDVLRATSFELWDALRTDPVERRRLPAGERRHMESRERPRLPRGAGGGGPPEGDRRAPAAAAGARRGSAAALRARLARGQRSRVPRARLYAGVAGGCDPRHRPRHGHRTRRRRRPGVGGGHDPARGVRGAVGSGPESGGAPARARDPRAAEGGPRGDGPGCDHRRRSHRPSARPRMDPGMLVGGARGLRVVSRGPLGGYHRAHRMGPQRGLTRQDLVRSTE